MSLVRYFRDNSTKDAVFVEESEGRMAACIYNDRIISDIRLNSEVDALLSYLQEQSADNMKYNVSEKFVRFILDNSYKIDESQFVFSGEYSKQIDDLNPNKKVVIKYNGLRAVKQALKALKASELILSSWYVTKLPYKKPIS